MANVSVVGSGMMGSALTRAFLAAGHDVKVYDLDATKTEPLVELGASAAQGPVELVEHAEILMPSLPSYEALRSFLESDGVLAALKGKILMQASTGSPSAVREFAEFMSGTDVRYIEARIKNYPGQIGQKGSKIIFGGEERIFQDAKPVLAALAEKLEYVGPGIDSVAVLDLAVLPASYGQYWGVLQGAKLVQENGIDPMIYAEIVRETTLLNLDDTMDVSFPDLASGEYRVNDDTASIRVWHNAGEETLDAFRDVGLNVEVFGAIQGLLEKAMERGLGDKALHAIAAVLKE